MCTHCCAKALACQRHLNAQRCNSCVTNCTYTTSLFHFLQQHQALRQRLYQETCDASDRAFTELLQGEAAEAAAKQKKAAKKAKKTEKAAAAAASHHAKDHGTQNGAADGGLSKQDDDAVDAGVHQVASSPREEKDVTAEEAQDAELADLMSAMMSGANRSTAKAAPTASLTTTAPKPAKREAAKAKEPVPPRVAVAIKPRAEPPVNGRPTVVSVTRPKATPIARSKHEVWLSVNVCRFNTWV